MDFEGQPKMDEFPQAKVENLYYEENFELSHINNNERVLVGGDLLRGKTYEMIMDIEPAMTEVLNAMHERREKIDRTKLKNLLDSNNMDVSVETFTALHAFTKELADRYPELHLPEGGEVGEKRHKTYESSSDGKVKVSELFDDKAVQCAEISALAQYFFQQESITSSMIHGLVIFDKESEPIKQEAHVYILIKDNGKEYIYDPANPIVAGEVGGVKVGNLVSLYSPNVDFSAKIREGKPRYVTAQRMIIPKEAYYGVGIRYQSVNPQEDIV